MNKALVSIILITILSCDTKTSRENTTSSPAIVGDLQVIDGDDFSISFPKDWIADQSKSMGTSFILFATPAEDGKFRDNINLVVQKLPDTSYDLNKYVDISLKQLSTMVVNSNLVESKRIEKNADEH